MLQIYDNTPNYVSDKNPGLQEKREAPTVKENENLCLFFFADLLKITKC